MVVVVASEEAEEEVAETEAAETAVEAAALIKKTGSAPKVSVETTTSLGGMNVTDASNPGLTEWEAVAEVSTFKMNLEELVDELLDIVYLQFNSCKCSSPFASGCCHQKRKA